MNGWRCLVEGCGRFVGKGEVVCGEHRRTEWRKEADRAVRRVMDEAVQREDGLAREGVAEEFRRRVASGDYGALFDEPVRRIVQEAAEEKSLDQELGLLRMMMARLVVEEGDAVKQAMAMSRLVTAAARVVKTQVEVGGGRDTLQEWISEVLKKVGPGRGEQESCYWPVSQTLATLSRQEGDGMGRELQTNLQRAKEQRRDEFYTQLTDIESELRRYRNQLRGKVVFCNCDDPYESNFFKYFANNFNFIGLKKLIAISYTGSPIAGAQLPLLEIEGLKPDGRQPFQIEINEVPDANSDGAIDLADVQDLLRHDRNSATPLEGNGDFRSAECVELLRQVDIVCTNPPFSLFREFVDQLMEHGKQFLILGSQNALTYRETFQYIKQDRMWLGYDNGGTKWFRVPIDYSVPTESRMKTEDGVKYISFGSINWYTNLDTTKRQEEITLYKRFSPEVYPKYVNYDAIEVGRVLDIPLDYEGEMGVPITFLDKYNPKQFEIVGSSQTHSRPMSEIASRGTYVQGGPRFYLEMPNGKYRYTRLFDRLLIRHRTKGNS